MKSKREKWKKWKSFEWYEILTYRLFRAVSGLLMLISVLLLDYSFLSNLKHSIYSPLRLNIKFNIWCNHKNFLWKSILPQNIGYLNLNNFFDSFEQLESILFFLFILNSYLLKLPITKIDVAYNKIQVNVLFNAIASFWSCLLC